MGTYLSMRRRYINECWKYARKNWVVAVVDFAVTAYGVMSSIVEHTDPRSLPSISFSLPRLSLPWVIVVLLASIIFILVEGGSRLRSAEVESLRSQTKTRAEIERQIKLLTRHIEQGQQLIQRCRTENELVPNSDAEGWAAETEQLIKAIFDGTYIARFRSGVGVPMGGAYWPNLKNRDVDGFCIVRVYRLQGFVDELRTKLVVDYSK
jgi:hypothetical protein